MAQLAAVGAGRGPDKDVQANEWAMQAVVDIRKLGEELRQAVERLDSARATMKEHGIAFEPQFDPHVQDAIDRLRGVPYWDRKPKDER